MKDIGKLVSIGSEALVTVSVPSLSTGPWSAQLQSELLGMLRLRNGFYAFEGALHVLPAGRQPSVMTLEEWNSTDLWRYEYGDLSEGLVLFAEDAFGNQFCLRKDGVCAFEAETGQAKLIAPGVEDWARRVLSDNEFLTGFPFFHDWQALHGRVPAGSRVLPVVPFILGGEYSSPNLAIGWCGVRYAVPR